MTGAARQDLQIILTRDSVCMADDIDAPHEVRFTLPAGATIGALCATIPARSYLARIAGGAASWSVTAGRRKIAALAQQLDAPVFLLDSDMPLDRFSDGNHAVRVHVEYHAQQDPMAVAKSLRRPDGHPIP